MKKITTRQENYSQWYLDVIENASLAEHSNVKGCMVIKPNGYALWENIQKVLGAKIKETGHRNAYFPIFVPKSTLSKEEGLAKGFAKECAVVTHYRLKAKYDGTRVEVDDTAVLEEELIVRPTSEAIIYETFSSWVKSWRDLPLLINQWANVVRWEMRTRLFLRTTEFLWQEGHTVHATFEEAETEAIKMLNVYADLAENYLAIPVVKGIKSNQETFPGAHHTYTIEALMQDGKALQAGTSHNLSDGFAKAFDIKFSDKDSTQKYAFQTSWGLSTRIIGGLIMMHSDDRGLVVPPKIAAVKVVIVPIGKAGEEFSNAVEKANELKSILNEKGISVVVDSRDYETPGFKFNDWEAQGVPIRLELGQKDLQARQCVLVRRDTYEKANVLYENLAVEVEKTLEKIQENLFKKAKAFVEASTFEVQSYDELKAVISNKKGFIKAFWCEDDACETAIKDETKATTRCLPLDSSSVEGKCVYCGKKASHAWYFAQAY